MQTADIILGHLAEIVCERDDAKKFYENASKRLRNMSEALEAQENEARLLRDQLAMAEAVAKSVLETYALRTGDIRKRFNLPVDSTLDGNVLKRVDALASIDSMLADGKRDVSALQAILREASAANKEKAP